MGVHENRSFLLILEGRNEKKAISIYFNTFINFYNSHLYGDPLRIYLDVCCLCRPFDDHEYKRIRQEAEAVLTILDRCSRDWELISSTAIHYEVDLIADPSRKAQVRHLVEQAVLVVAVDSDIASRVTQFERSGINGMDAVHLACAERAEAVFLTTDDDVTRIMMQHLPDISIRVDNPVHWLEELNCYGE